MQVKFKFKTTNTDGTLLYFGTKHSSDFLRVSLVDGYVRLAMAVTDASGYQETLEFDSFYSFADGKENEVLINIENDERDDCKMVVMTISGHQTDYNSERLYTLEYIKSNGILYLGGDATQNDSQNHNNGLDGCMAFVSVNDKAIRLIEDAKKTGALNRPC